MRETKSAWDVADTPVLVSFPLCVILSSAGKLGEHKTKVIILFLQSLSP